MNDLVRAKVRDEKTGEIKLRWEIIAGGTAGGCQVVSTRKWEDVTWVEEGKEEVEAEGERQSVLPDLVSPFPNIEERAMSFRCFQKS